MNRRARDLLKILVALLVTGGLLEISYRFVRALLDPEPVVPTGVGRFDARLGWGLEPNASASSSRTGRRIPYRINSLGLRDDETSYAKPPGSYRIALLGDSRTFGFGVPIEQHFSRLLEGYFERLEVINMGISGFGVDQELLLLREEGFRYDPDLVIAYVAHFGDHRHMHANRFGQAKPIFELHNGELVLTHSAVPTEYEGLDLAHRIDRFLTRHSPLYRDVTQLAFGLGHGVRARKTSTSKQADDAEARDPEFMERLYELAGAILQQMQRDAESHGARFVLVTQVPRLAADCARLGLTCLDVRGPLSNGRFDLPDALEHINEAGNGVLAWELATFLRRTRLVPEQHWKAAESGPHY